MIRFIYALVSAWWHQRKAEAASYNARRRDHENAVRARIIKQELAEMQWIVAQAKRLGEHGAAISTSRQIIGDGIDKHTAAVMLQQLHAALAKCVGR